MTIWLKQSTAYTWKAGPFVDSSDGVTAETGLSIAQADIRLAKNGGAYAQSNNAAGATHAENGIFHVPLNTPDTGTLGVLRADIRKSGALPVWETFMVVPANVWDSLFGADRLQVHADEITAGLITAAAIASNAIDADALAADAVTEIQSGLASAADLATVDGVADAIKAKTDTLPASPAATGDIAAALAAYDPPTKAELDAAMAALNDVSVADIVAGVTVDGYDLIDILRIIGAVAVGKSSGGATGTNVFRDIADTVDMVTSTVSEDGDRSAVVIDLGA